jgi:ATPase family associated with various cellular activities (AAA)
VSEEARQISASEFGDAFKDFLEEVSRTPAEEPPLQRRLREHFGADPASLQIVAEQFEPSDHPNLQVALDAYLAGGRREADLVGVAAEQRRYMGVTLSDLIAPTNSGLVGNSTPREGPVEYANLQLGEEKILPCVRFGLFFIREGEERLAALISTHEQGPWHALRFEAMAPRREAAEEFLAQLRRSMRERSVYRGRVLSLSQESYEPLKVELRSLPKVSRDGIILPQGLLERIERHSIGFSRHSERLFAAGRHLKRGVLLHGRPGTGKTLTAMYLATRMDERTTLLVTGTGQGLIERCCTMARTLQPSLVVIEDVDLIAEERTRPDAACPPLLFELLNQMDGLAEDADVMFLLTTNRPELLEPALASRPGRIDQAIELPLPDGDCRLRLLELYGEGLTLEIRSLADYVARTEGASGAFIRELMRKAALFAADESGALVVRDRHLDEALHELLVEGGALTRSLLGADIAE